jgi:hypothetical protein
VTERRHAFYFFRPAWLRGPPRESPTSLLRCRYDAACTCSRLAADREWRRASSLCESANGHVLAIDRSARAIAQAGAIPVPVRVGARIAASAGAPAVEKGLRIQPGNVVHDRDHVAEQHHRREKRDQEKRLPEPRPRPRGP